MKVHLKETTKRPEDWKQSPHIFNALKKGIYAACHAGCCDTEHITEDPAKVTCRECLAALGQPQLQSPAPMSNTPKSKSSSLPKYHKAKTSDIRGTFSDEVYPRGKANSNKLPFDFVFSKNGLWFYMSSSDSPEKLRDILAPPVVAAKERWRVVEYATGKIVLSSEAR